ncbi:MAG: hypothetical protein WCI73_04660, partial [Phycisphaerae bacterium]
KGLKLFDAAEVVRLEYDPAMVAQMLLQTVNEVLDGKPVKPLQEVPHQVQWPKAWKMPKARDPVAGHTNVSDR